MQTRRSGRRLAAPPSRLFRFATVAVDDAIPSQQRQQSSGHRFSLRAHFEHLNSDHDPPFLNRTYAEPISFSLSPTWMIACDGLRCMTPIARRPDFHAFKLTDEA
jgi:hypothetical protein